MFDDGDDSADRNRYGRGLHIIGCNALPFLLFRTFKDFIRLINGYKKNEKYPFRYYFIHILVNVLWYLNVISLLQRG